MTGPAVQAYLMTHTGPHLQGGMSGSSTAKGKASSWEVSLHEIRAASATGRSPSDPPMLAYQIAPFARGVGIRVDAEVVPAHARCASG